MGLSRVSNSLIVLFIKTDKVFFFVSLFSSPSFSCVICSLRIFNISFFFFISGFSNVVFLTEFLIVPLITFLQIVSKL